MRTVDEVRELWDDLAPHWRWNSVSDGLLGVTRVRRQHFSGVTGDVLDVGCGTGENFRYLTNARTIKAVDLSPAMLSQARDRATRIGLEADLREADAGRLPFEDDSFDIVVTAMSSCTFPDHVAAFREMQRVARRGGEIRLLEHGRSSVGWIAKRQDAGVERLIERGNCRNNRNPRAEIEEAGLTIASERRTHLGIVSRLVVDVT